jgi:2-oxoisovalerate dehydrogenase E1 component
LPVIFVCENNLYATEIPFAKISRSKGVAQRGQAYGIPGVEVDGNDVMEVYTAAREAVANARAGIGPTLIECKTYRTRAHSEGMRDTGYRSQAEIDAWKVRDPIKSYKARLVELNQVTQTEIDELEKTCLKVAEDAALFGRQSQFPDPDSVMAHLFEKTAEVPHA